MDSMTVDPNLVVTRFARTMGYGLFNIKVLIVTEALAVASSNFFARSILYSFASRRKGKKQAYVENIQLTEISLLFMYVSKNSNYLKYLLTCRGENLRV